MLNDNEPKQWKMVPLLERTSTGRKRWPYVKMSILSESGANSVNRIYKSILEAWVEITHSELKNKSENDISINEQYL